MSLEEKYGEDKNGEASQNIAAAGDVVYNNEGFAEVKHTHRELKPRQ